MAHINDYILWRGDLTFSEREFKTEDNLVFSELIYIDFKSVLKDGRSMTIEQAINELDSKGLLKSTRAGAGKEDLDFARYCAACARYKDICLYDFQDIYDSQDKQFAAVTYKIPNGPTIIAFRGTDSTIIGWKEDFMISYTNVPSQDLALSYATKHVDEADGSVIILGHSKGAHLALYAAAHLEGSQQDKLLHVYINDGPGFCPDILDKSLIYRILSKITKITPEYSIIGRIFEPPAGESIIIKSSANPLIQHSIQTWVLDSNGPVMCDDHAPESHLLNDLIDRFVEGMDMSAREKFVDTLFDSMSDTGVNTIKEFASLGPSAFEELIMKMAGNDALNLKNKARSIKKEDDDSKGLFVRIWGLINRKQLIRIGLSLFLSALCFAFPDFAMESVVFLALLIVCVYEVVLTIKHLRDSGLEFRKERPRVIMCIILLVLTSAIMIKPDALFVISSMIIGVVLLTLAYQNVINFRNQTKVFDRFRSSFEGIVTVFLGGYILVTPDIENSWYMLSCGMLLLVDAIFEILKMLRDRHK
ncbi:MULTISPECIES: Mbeg1-like protein [unclassified Butyrivibrio]|uniref:Mbeg1-like protein n=1 Tax=unclassified Butyrivibrio TaxID=2639466 RepID=UPI0003B7584E|nr:MULTISPECIES: Mbeg1-like protein [unclassified Butyrivibrio]